MWFARQTRALVGGCAVPTPRHWLSVCADRPGPSVLLVGWGLRTWGRGRLRACWLGHAVAVSGRWVWYGGPVREVPSAGARSLGLLGLAPLWRSSAVLPGPLPGCLPPTNAVAVRSSSTFPESWGLRTGSGPCGGLRVGLGGARPPAGEGVPVAGPDSGSLRAASSGPTAWVSASGSPARWDPCWDLCWGMLRGWPSACVRPVPELVPSPAVGGQRCWRGIPSFLGSPVAASWRRAGVVEEPRWQTVHGDEEGPLGAGEEGVPPWASPSVPSTGCGCLSCRPPVVGPQVLRPSAQHGVARPWAGGPPRALSVLSSFPCRPQPRSQLAAPEWLPGWTSAGGSVPETEERGLCLRAPALASSRHPRAAARLLPLRRGPEAGVAPL